MVRFQLILKTNQPKPHLEPCFSTWRLLSYTSLRLTSPSPHSPWPDFSSHSLADILIDFTEALRASCCLHLVGIFQSFPHQTSLPHVSLLFVFLLDAVDCWGVTTCSVPSSVSLCHPPLGIRCHPECHPWPTQLSGACSKAATPALKPALLPVSCLVASRPQPEIWESAHDFIPHIL